MNNAGLGAGPAPAVPPPESPYFNELYQPEEEQQRIVPFGTSVSAFHDDGLPRVPSLPAIPETTTWNDVASPRHDDVQLSKEVPATEEPSSAECEHGYIVVVGLAGGPYLWRGHGDQIFSLGEDGLFHGVTCPGDTVPTMAMMFHPETTEEFVFADALDADAAPNTALPATSPCQLTFHRVSFCTPARGPKSTSLKPSVPRMSPRPPPLDTPPPANQSPKLQTARQLKQTRRLVVTGIARGENGRDLLLQLKQLGIAVDEWPRSFQDYFLRLRVVNRSRKGKPARRGMFQCVTMDTEANARWLVEQVGRVYRLKGHYWEFKWYRGKRQERPQGRVAPDP